MRTRIAATVLRIVVVAAVAAAGVTVGPPVASASDAKFECFFDAFSEPTMTGTTYQGFAHGFVAGTGTVSINCHIVVNGAVVAQTGTQTGDSVAYTAADISFNATATDDIDICADVTQHGYPTRVCYQGQHQQNPPEFVYDEVDGALARVRPITEPRLCSLLARLWGTYGPVYINSQGDVFVDGDPYYDCPPYDQRVADYPRIDWVYRP